MIRTFNRRLFVGSSSFIHQNCIYHRPMATKFQLNTEPEGNVQSRIKTFTPNIEPTSNLMHSKEAPSVGAPIDYRKTVEEKFRFFLDITKRTFFVTCERAIVVVQSKEMKDAFDQTFITLQYYFYLIRRIAEEIVVIAQKMSQYIREKSPKDGGTKNASNS